MKKKDTFKQHLPTVSMAGLICFLIVAFFSSLEGELSSIYEIRVETIEGVEFLYSEGKPSVRSCALAYDDTTGVSRVIPFDGIKSFDIKPQ